MTTEGQDTALLERILRAVDDTFREFDASNLDRIDVLSKLAGHALAFCEPADRDAAIREFVRLVREYHDRYLAAFEAGRQAALALAAAEPKGHG